MKVRKRLIEVHAFQMTRERMDNNVDWPAWLGKAWQGGGEEGTLSLDPSRGRAGGYVAFRLATREGIARVNVDDYIVQGVEGELYPVSASKFEELYDFNPSEAVSVVQGMCAVEKPVCMDAVLVVFPFHRDPEAYPWWYLDAFNYDTLWWDLPGNGVNRLCVHTSRGTLSTSPGNYIIRDPDGSIYPVDASIFRKTYDILLPGSGSAATQTNGVLDRLQREVDTEAAPHEEFPFPKGALVEVIWIDSVTADDTWLGEEDVANLTVPIIKTTGYIVRHTDTDLAIAGCKVDASGKTELRPYGAVSVIPDRAILSGRVLQMPSSMGAGTGPVANRYRCGG